MNEIRAILEAKHISKSFNGLRVLEDVSFSLQGGTISSLFGKNGSGKTTLFHIITGFLSPAYGRIYLQGHPISGLAPEAIAQLGIGRVWQTPRVCRNLSVLENLLLASPQHPGEKWWNYLLRPKTVYLEEKCRRTIAEEQALQLTLKDKINKPAGSLSYGQQKLLSIGMLLMNDAKVLIMDEPFSGVHHTLVDKTAQFLETLKSRGKTIFLIEHNQDKAQEISDNIFLLEKGSIIQLKTVQR